MTIEVAEGEVHLDGAAWLSLIDGTAPAPQRDAVAGVPGMDIALEAGAEPAAVVQLDLITPGGAFTHEAWVAPEGMALLVDLGGGRRRLMALPPDHLAAGLARLVGLGPRRTPARVARDVGEDELEAWFGQDDAEPAADGRGRRCRRTLAGRAVRRGDAAGARLPHLGLAAPGRAAPRAGLTGPQRLSGEGLCPGVSTTKPATRAAPTNRWS